MRSRKKILANVFYYWVVAAVAVSVVSYLRVRGIARDAWQRFWPLHLS